MWGRRRARREQETAEAAEVAGSLADSLRATVDSADETHRGLLELREHLARQLAEIAVLIGHGDGLPVDAIRRQTDTAELLLSEVDRMSGDYAETRSLLVGKDEGDLDEIMPALEALAEHAQGMAEVGESLAGLTESMGELREGAQRLRGELIPLRERVRAALSDADDELTASRGAPGWFGRQASLANLGDRLTALDEGRVVPTPEHTVSDFYRELERDIAALRDEMATEPD
ncbi:hypothetical protein OIB37_26330 [Streptomyces sp. NBC_00820]|uniref:hypothetical protein n=1 Tax=Streptomyces sp. NBC_00820 TaxID=2975842 RepID=UPI002ED4702B|nr:hypothetical protein OIB37_26330 [Streptomyces sp. NBC_00820]